MSAKEALIISDMLNDFCREGAPLEVPSTRSVIPNIQREIARVRGEGGVVVYVCDAHAPDDPEFRNWPTHAVAGSEGSRVIDELAPKPADRVVTKTTLLGFYKTGLGAVLREEGVSIVTVTGCVTNICVMLIAHEAAVRGYRVRVPKDCVAGLDPEMHEFALRQMKEVIRAEIV
jgi:nicotinamidase/pyrazinamidase